MRVTHTLTYFSVPALTSGRWCEFRRDAQRGVCVLEPLFVCS
jgi:hypothetical protein